MKKFFALIVGMVLGLGSISSQSFDSGGLIYSVLSLDDKTCSVMGVNKSYESSDLEIPPTVVYDGIEYRVTNIGGKSFSGSNWNSISFPFTLEKIEPVAFSGVSGVREIIIPNSVIEIESEAFSNCSDLEQLQLGTSLNHIGRSAFAGSPVMVVVASGETPAQLENGFAVAFNSNPIVAVAAELVPVYRSVWEGANIVENLPAETLTLNKENYTLLPGESVQLNADIYPENAPFGLFSSNTAVLTVDNQGMVTADKIMEGWEADVTAISVNGVRAICHIQTGYMEHFQCDGFDYAILQDVGFKVAVTDFDRNATNIVIPESVENNGIVYEVTAIGYNVFSNCDNLEEVTIPASVKRLGGYNFSSCAALKRVTFEDASTPLELGMYNFYNNNRLTDLYVGRNIVNSEGCFTVVSCLANIILGTAVTYVADNIFQSCRNLSVVVSNNVVPPTLGNRPFGYYPNREKIKIVVPEESIEAYKVAWGEIYPNIIKGVDADEIRFEPAELTIYSGQSFTLSLIVEPEDATIIWNSSNPSLISVDGDGKVSYPVNYSGTTPTGEIIITATSLNGRIAECKLEAERWFTFSEEDVIMTPGSEKKIEVFRVDAMGESPIRWKSNNANCVSVDDEGQLTAHEYGDATITASAYVSALGWNVNYPVTVKVRDYPVWVTPVNELIRLEKGEEQVIELNFEPNDNPYLIKDIAWTVEHPEIAQIREYEGNYIVVGIKNGTTVINGITPNGLTVQINVEVGIGQEEVILLNPDITVVCRYGEVIELEFLSGDTGEVNTEMTWTVEDPEIARISVRSYFNEETQKEEKEYRVTGYRLGTTGFAGETANGYKVRGTITVVGVYIDYETGDSNILNVTLDEEIQLNLKTSSEDLLNSLTYSYRDQILSISSTGVLKGVECGSSFVDAYYYYEGKRYEANSIWVTVHPKAGNIFLSQMECVLKEDSDEYLTVYLPIGDESDITWESSDPGIVEVEGSGESARISYKSAGKATVTVSTSNGLSATCEVVCVSVTLGESDIELALGQTYQLDLRIDPEVEWDKLYWFSDENVVIVDENGLMTAVGIGETWVNVEFFVPAYNQWFNTSVNVKVIEDIKISDLTVSPNILILEVGESEQLVAIVLPENATNKTLAWSTSNESIATVDDNGLVTVVGEGEATITVMTTDGSDLEAYCYLNGLSGIGALRADGESSDVYNMNGVIVKKDAAADDFNKLAPGIYIVRRGNISAKLILR